MSKKNDKVQNNKKTQKSKKMELSNKLSNKSNNLINENFINPYPVDVYVGKRLKEKRSDLGISQNMLGQLLGISFQQVQKYEKGLNRISSGKLYQLSKILNVKVSYFFENYEYMPAIKNECGKEDNEEDNEALQKDIRKAIRLLESANNLCLRKQMLDAMRCVFDGATKFKNEGNNNQNNHKNNNQ